MQGNKAGLDIRFVSRMCVLLLSVLWLAEQRCR